MKLTKIPLRQAELSVRTPGSNKVYGLAYQSLIDLDTAWCNDGTLYALRRFARTEPEILDERDDIQVFRPISLMMATAHATEEIAMLALTRNESVVGICYARDSDDDIPAPSMAVGKPAMLTYVLNGRRWAILTPPGSLEGEPMATWLRETVWPGDEEVDWWLKKIGFEIKTVSA